MRIDNGKIMGLAAYTIPGISVFLPLSMATISYIFGVLLIFLNSKNLFGISKSLKPAWVFSLFLLWSAASLAWSVDISFSLGKYPRLVLSVALGLVIVISAIILTNKQKSVFEKLLMPGFIWCLLLLVAGLMRESGELLPFFGPHNGIPGKELSRLNQGCVILVLLFWPVLTLHWCNTTHKLILLGCIFLPISLSSSAAALTGLSLSAFVFIVAFFWSRVALRIITLACLLYIAIAPILHAHFTHPNRWGITQHSIAMKETWLPHSAYHRLLIWNFTAEKALERPLTGWGFASSRALPGGKENLGMQMESLPLHPHNGVLQIWVELGAVGALLAALMCLSITKCLGRLQPGPDKAAGISLFTCAFVIICVSHGIWQGWWMAALFLSVAFFIGAKRKNPE